MRRMTAMMCATSSELARARDAAVVIVARDARDGIEVYMLRRSAAARAVPDAYVFPGGAVDAADRSPIAHGQLAGPWRPEEHEFTYAAIRETFEERGLLFASAPVADERSRAARAQLLAKTRTFAEEQKAVEPDRRP